MGNELQTKTFWQRPEGKTGLITLGAVLVGLFFAAQPLIGFFGQLITLLGQTYAIAALGGGLFMLFMVGTNSSFQQIVSYGFKLIMRKLTGWFVEIDPIGIMKIYITTLVEKLEMMYEAKVALQGQITICQRQINQNVKDYDHAMKVAKVANDSGNMGVFNVNSNQAGRLEKLNKEKLGPLLMQMATHMRLLDKYYEVTQTVIEDTKNEVSAGEMERKMVLASYKAMSLAKRILMGAGNDREMFDQAKEYVAQDIGMKLGEIDSFINNSKSFVEGLDIQNGVFQADALEKLKAWESKADSILLGKGKQQVLEHQSQNSPLVGLTVAPSISTVDYASLLRK